MAQPWTMVAGAFAIDNDTLSRADINMGVLRHRPNEAGNIFAVGNVTKLHDSGSDWNRLQIVYRDQDGKGTLEGLNVSLMKMTNSGEQIAIAGFQSSDYDGSSFVQKRSVPFSHTFDFLLYAYFIRVLLMRNFPIASESRVALYAVRLITSA